MNDGRLLICLHQVPVGRNRFVKFTPMVSVSFSLWFFFSALLCFICSIFCGMFCPCTSVLKGRYARDFIDFNSELVFLKKT